MAGSIKLIKRRIKSIASTAKMTRAMQMIATVGMRKAVNQEREAVPFAAETIHFLNHFAAYADKHHLDTPYLQNKPVERVLAVVVASNRGLCGSFHAQLEKEIRQFINEPARLINYPFDSATAAEKKMNFHPEFDWIILGKKGENIIKHLGQQNIVASYTQLSENVDHQELKSVFQLIQTEYLSGKYQRVIIFYTQYVNTLKQVPLMRQILPISLPEIHRLSDSWASNVKNYQAETATPDFNYTIEPSITALLDNIVLLLIRTMIYHCLLESKASVESARMLAMKNATDAASDIKDELTLAYNQLRQSKITNEIAEISAGSAALE